MTWPFSFFYTPSLRDIKNKELAVAERQLLLAQTARDYAQSLVVYNEARIKRLSE